MLPSLSASDRVGRRRNMTRFACALALLLCAAGMNAQESGYIKARGRPSNAAIFVDGKYVGPAYRFTVPEKYAVPSGTVEVTFRDPRYDDFVTKITVAPK